MRGGGRRKTSIILKILEKDKLTCNYIDLSIPFMGEAIFSSQFEKIFRESHLSGPSYVFTHIADVQYFSFTFVASIHCLLFSFLISWISFVNRLHWSRHGIELEYSKFIAVWVSNIFRRYFWLYYIGYIKRFENSLTHESRLLWLY